MPKVDFYILADQNPNGRQLLACRLTEKAYSLGHTVYIHVDNAEEAQRLDDLLWTFRDGSFVPHTLFPAAADDTSPVLIGWHADSAAGADVLINLGAEVPAFFERFERIAELVNQEPIVLQTSRQRFRAYRDRGLNPETHKI